MNANHFACKWKQVCDCPQNGRIPLTATGPPYGSESAVPAPARALEDGDIHLRGHSPN